MSLNRPASMEYFDRSGFINPSAHAESPFGQIVLDYNPKRVGFDFQNRGKSDMHLCIWPVNAVGVSPCVYTITPGETWYKDQFAPINVVSVVGTEGDPFSASEYGI